MAAIEQHGGLSVRCGKLEPPRRGLIGRLYLSNDASERAIAKRILGHGQYRGILAALGIKDLVGSESDLFESGRVEIEARQRPEHGEARTLGKARRDPGGEQGRGGIIAERRGSGAYFVEARAVESAIGKPVIDRVQAERQHRPSRPARMGELGAERGKLFGARPLGKGWVCGHMTKNNDSCVLFMFP